MDGAAPSTGAVPSEFAPSNGSTSGTIAPPGASPATAACPPAVAAAAFAGGVHSPATVEKSAARDQVKLPRGVRPSGSEVRSLAATLGATKVRGSSGTVRTAPAAPRTSFSSRWAASDIGMAPVVADAADAKAEPSIGNACSHCETLRNDAPTDGNTRINDQTSCMARLKTSRPGPAAWMASKFPVASDARAPASAAEAPIACADDCATPPAAMVASPEFSRSRVVRTTAAVSGRPPSNCIEAARNCPSRERVLRPLASAPGDAADAPAGVTCGIAKRVRSSDDRASVSHGSCCGSTKSTDMPAARIPTAPASCSLRAPIEPGRRPPDPADPIVDGIAVGLTVVGNPVLFACRFEFDRGASAIDVA